MAATAVKLQDFSRTFLTLFDIFVVGHLLEGRELYMWSMGPSH